MARYLKRAEGIAVSHNFIAQLWRDHDLQPQRQGTFKLSNDPDFEAKVADVVGLYLDPPVGAVVLSIDEKTQVQALDRTQPVLPIDFAKTEKRTHDYVRTAPRTCSPRWTPSPVRCSGSATRGGAPRSSSSSWTQLSHGTGDREIHVVLDNLSTTKGMTWTLAYQASRRHLSFHPDRQFLVEPSRNLVQHHHEASDQRGTFTSLRVLIKTIQSYMRTGTAANYGQRLRRIIAA